MAQKRSCLIGLVITFTVVGATQLHFLLLHVSPHPHPCQQFPGIAIVRHHTNCSIYILCIAGHGIDMPPCPWGHVWSVKMVKCVPRTSPMNDCPLVSTHNDGIGDQKSLTSSLQVSHHDKIPTSYSAAVDTDFIENFFPSHPCTFIGTETVLPHPKACHRYYNCSLAPDDPVWSVIEPLTVECPYPKLFSLTTRTCLHYTKVDCDKRPEYKTPCDYRANKCNKPSCQSCRLRLAGCLGLTDGSHPFPSREWTPWYIVCKDERTLEQTTCDPKTPIFSHLTSKCVTSNLVPKQYGGHLPSCHGRPDGYHPDERGKCRHFFQCQNEEFLDSFSCEIGLVYDPETLTCVSNPWMPPCGNQVSSDVLGGLCRGLGDGFHADPFGRCSLYMECRHDRLVAYLKCPEGSFNPRSKTCEKTLSLPAPCGFQPNWCKSKEDGAYSGADCISKVTCRLGYVSSVDECSGDDVFDADSRSCRDVRLVVPGCGMMLGCHGKRDGIHTVAIHGDKYVYACHGGVLQNYGRCRHQKYDRFFNPLTRTCASLRDICSHCAK